MMNHERSIDVSHLSECMRYVPTLRVLPEESVDRLSKQAHHRHLKAGETVIHSGETIRALLVVARGRLKASRVHATGREQVVRELEHGDFFGELALFHDVTSDSDVMAVDDSVACVLDREALQKELQGSPAAAWSLVQALAERLDDAERMIAELALFDVQERLVSALLQMSEVGRRTSEGIEFTLPFSWAELAPRIGTTPESLSRRLKVLEASGLVITKGRDVVIPDAERLRERIAQ